MREGKLQLLNIQAVTSTRHAGTNARESTSSRRHTAAQNAKNKSHVSVLYTNAHTLIPKKDKLSAYIAVEKPELLRSEPTPRI